MNLFNQFNCRIVEDGKFNVFSGLWKNYFFILVIAFEFFLTWLMVDIGATTIGSSLIGTAGLNPIMHLVVWCIGGSTLLMGAIIKKIPAEKFDKIASKISLEEEREDDPLNQLFNKASEVHSKARKSIGIEAGAGAEDTNDQSAS